jgi:hypothetical protein
MDKRFLITLQSDEDRVRRRKRCLKFRGWPAVETGTGDA